MIRVVNANGAPASGAVVTMKRVRDGAELGIEAANDNGQVLFEPVSEAVEVTATSTDESMVTSWSNGYQTSTELRLARGCDRLDVSVRAMPPLPDGTIVRLFGLDKDGTTHRYAARTTVERAIACVPRGDYSIRVPYDYSAPRAIVTVPSPAAEIKAIANDSLKSAPDQSMVLRHRTEHEFAGSVARSVRILGLGESNHGTREFYEERTKLVIDLAREQNFTVMMIEAGYGETIALDEYVNLDRNELGTSLPDLGYWIWDTFDFVRALGLLRDYNSRQPRPKRIHIVGIDMQDTAGAIDRILASKLARPSAHVTDLLRGLQVDKGNSWAGLSTEDQLAVRSSLDGVSQSRRPGNLYSNSNRVALCAQAVLARLDAVAVDDAYIAAEQRDKAMAQLVVATLSLAPAARATLWAHIAHIARQYVIPRTTLGRELNDQYGETYRVFALLATDGFARAWDPRLSVGVIPQQLSHSPDYSLEGALAGQQHSADISYWTFADETGSALRWLQNIRLMREFGARFPAPNQDFQPWDLASIDGAILFHDVHPTDPTPTGERHAKH